MAEVNLLKSIPYSLTAPSSRIWIDYDEASDFNSGDSENKINGSENPEMG